MFYKAPNTYIIEGSPFTLDGNQYPANWLNLSTPQEKEELGLVEVTYIGSPKNDKYYWVSSELENGVLTYTNTPKDLDTCKSDDITSVKNKTFSTLQPTDYIETRNLRDPSYKPEWITWRDSVRQTSQSAIVDIQACTSVDELSELVISWPEQPSE
jgi:hypothetical protein